MTTVNSAAADAAWLRAEVAAQQKRIAELQETLRAFVAAQPVGSPTSETPAAIKPYFEAHAQNFGIAPIILNSVITACSFVQMLAWRDVIDRLIKSMTSSAVGVAASAEDASSGDEDFPPDASGESLTNASFEALLTTVLCVFIAAIAIRCVRPFCQHAHATVGAQVSVR